ncbi:MAG: CBS domain-containing protein [Rhodospirillaceae bacterium]
MKVSEVMTPCVEVVSPADPIVRAACLMRDKEIGFLPVIEGEKLVGGVTDRDIVIRGVADGLAAQGTIRDVMTKGAHYCFEDEDLDAAADKMSESQIRRLPVFSRANKLVGVLSLGDISQANEDEAGNTLEQVTEAGGPHAH